MVLAMARTPSLSRGSERTGRGGRGRGPGFGVLVRAVDVEEFQPGPLRRDLVPGGDRGGHPQVEGVLAPAVQVERTEVREPGRVVLEAGAAVAVGAGGGGVDEARAGLRAP